MSGDQFLFVLVLGWAVFASVIAFDQSLVVYRCRQRIKTLVRSITAKNGEE